MFDMFTSASLINSRLVSDKEHSRFINLMDAYSKTEPGKFLNYINFRSMDFYWCDNMTAQRGVMGAWLCWLGSKVYLMPGNHPDLPFMDETTWCAAMAPTLVHELFHVWQYKRSRLKYVLCCFPVVRELTIEAEADVVCKDAMKYFQNLENIKAVIACNERMEKWQDNPAEKLT